MDYIPVVFDPASEKPLYRQIYACLSAEIAAGRIKPGQRLPARRSAAANLGVSRNTVETAYAMLEEEGYIETRPRSGHFVADISPLAPPPAPRVSPAGPVETILSPVHTAGTSAHTPPLPTGTNAPAQPVVRFSTRGMDPTLFPAKTWARIEKEVLSTQPDLLTLGEAAGDGVLRQAIADYLSQYRAVHCVPEQVVVGAGVEYLLGLLAQLFCGQRVAVEDPGYEKTAVILHNSGVPTVPVPVDGDGMQVEALAQSGVQLAYVTPSHQFPTGACMPMARRSALLAWAAQQPDRLVIEDDYDSEFRFSGRTIPSLQGLCATGQVVYLSTFSQSIAPSIRMAYMVLPPRLLALWRQRFSGYASTVSRFEQHTMAAFLARGHFARYLNRARGVYRRRRDALCAAFEQAFGEQAQLAGLHTGLFLTARLQLGLSEQHLCERAKAAGVQVTGLSRYYRNAESAPAGTLVLGYAGMDERAIAAGVALLQQAWQPPPRRTGDGVTG